MKYHYQAGVIVPFAQKHYKQLILAVAAIFMASFAMLTAISNAAVVLGCSFDESVASVWSLEGDCTSSAEIYIPAGTTLDGNGFTISAGFAFTNSSNNAVLGVLTDDVTIQDLTIEGSGGTSLHGINVFEAENVQINDVTIKNNDKSGLVVNGSEVTVNNISTEGNTWHGVNVDLGSGVTSPAALTINGDSSHTELLHVYVDNTLEDVTVIDTESQYNVTVNPPIGGANDELYTLKVQLDSKDQCKNGGWMDSEAPVFKNQGQCVSHFAKLQ